MHNKQLSADTGTNSTSAMEHEQASPAAWLYHEGFANGSAFGSPCEQSTPILPAGSTSCASQLHWTSICLLAWLPFAPYIIPYLHLSGRLLNRIAILIALSLSWRCDVVTL